MKKEIRRTVSNHARGVVDLRQSPFKGGGGGENVQEVDKENLLTGEKEKEPSECQEKHTEEYVYVCKVVCVNCFTD